MRNRSRRNAVCLPYELRSEPLSSRLKLIKRGAGRNFDPTLTNNTLKFVSRLTAFCKHSGLNLVCTLAKERKAPIVRFVQLKHHLAGVGLGVNGYLR